MPSTSVVREIPICDAQRSFNRAQCIHRLQELSIHIFQNDKSYIEEITEQKLFLELEMQTLFNEIKNLCCRALKEKSSENIAKCHYYLICCHKYKVEQNAQTLSEDFPFVIQCEETYGKCMQSLYDYRLLFFEYYVLFLNRSHVLQESAYIQYSGFYFPFHKQKTNQIVEYSQYVINQEKSSKTNYRSPLYQLNFTPYLYSKIYPEATNMFQGIEKVYLKIKYYNQREERTIHVKKRKKVPTAKISQEIQFHQQVIEITKQMVLYDKNKVHDLLKVYNGEYVYIDVKDLFNLWTNLEDLIKNYSYYTMVSSYLVVEKTFLMVYIKKSTDFILLNKNMIIQQINQIYKDTKSMKETKKSTIKIPCICYTVFGSDEIRLYKKHIQDSLYQK
ncbi:hypothetical protein AB837_00347 [bacterium AB1]|nr:hypothetical protein AB837_00347 [bacterium AB1]